MEIAIISDIHGNNYAFEKVMQIIDSRKIKKIFILGDIVGYYYHPEIIMSYFTNRDFVCVKGNHELFLLQSIINKSFLKKITEKYGHGIKYAIDSLNEEQIKYIKSLNEKIELNIDGLSMLLCHGSPISTDDYVYPTTDFSVLENFSKLGYDYVFMGHTHYPFVSHVDKTCFINPGSVGQSRNVGGVACWGILNTQNRVYTPMYTKYDIELLTKEIDKFDRDISYLKDVLVR